MADRTAPDQSKPDQPARPRTQLTRERIVSGALALVDREGLSALSMRRLGAELGVDPMATYHYIPNKDALLDAIVEAVMSEIDLAVDDPAAPAEERVLWAAKAYRDVMLAHVNALPIVLSRGPSTAAAARPVEVLIGILRDAGLTPAEAMAGMNTIAAAVRGMVGMVAHDREAHPETAEEIEALAAQFPIEEFPRLREAAAAITPDMMEQGFEFGIRALARGLVASAGDSQT